MKHLFTIIFLLALSLQVHAQDVYKTPSGVRYHLSSCKMVENVSSKLSGVAEIDTYRLTPCKICKPPSKNKLKKGNAFSDKSVGKSKSVQCKGITQKGKRCKHQTHLANGYCFQHTKQNSSPIPPKRDSTKTSTTSQCRGKTKSGKRCKRKVKNGNYCYQHN
ncbi:DUF5763 domain-containing protein [Kordia sp.]|uniref:DUF5763 domain-containing protein n=1 Tax=Kordia sp. TaxID=1965332 RepID=UPI003D6BB970